MSEIVSEVTVSLTIKNIQCLLQQLVISKRTRREIYCNYILISIQESVYVFLGYLTALFKVHRLCIVE